ncbi:MAG: cytochrome C [Bacteroidota bacterium]
MKKFVRILLTIVVIIIVLVGTGLAYFKSKFPVEIPVTEIKIERTPERIERGQYLVHHVTMCVDCHSERDWNYYSGPIKEESYGKGGEMFDGPIAGIPGKIFAKNITPAGIGNYTDGELIRVITTGITKKGQALFPLMPFNHYREMAREDIYSIVAYIRSLKPIENPVPERSLDFPMNLIVNTIPVPAAMIDAIPSKGDTLAYGKYMVNAAACIECHSQREKGELLKGLEFAGGFRFQLPNGDQIFTANITPDMETGIGALTKEGFIAKFKAFEEAKIPVKEHEKNTVMPWTKLSGMTETDLGAIYTYLRTIPPVKNKVITFRSCKTTL